MRSNNRSQRLRSSPGTCPTFGEGYRMKTLISLKSRLPALEARVGGISVPVEEALTKLAARYVRLGLQMPKVHAWRWNKLADSAVGGYDVEDLAATFGMSQNLESLLLVAAFAADIGRLAIVVEGRGNQEFHGSVSARILVELGIAARFGEAGPLIRTAISWHSRVKTPSLEDLRDDEAAWSLSCLLRDLDMCMNIRTAGKYVEDQKRMARERDSQGFTMEGAATPTILERFEAGGPIVRAECKTYVDHMLQFVAWRGNFTFQEVWDRAVAEGGFNPVIAWLSRSVVDDSDRNRILAAAKSEYGLAI